MSSSSSSDKDKPLDSDEDSLGVNAGGPGGVGGTPGSGPLRPNSQSAFLGPLLWERTLPCDGGLFQLQYMDLEEFLTENGMGMHSNGPSSANAQIPSQVTLLSFCHCNDLKSTHYKQRRRRAQGTQHIAGRAFIVSYSYQNWVFVEMFS